MTFPVTAEFQERQTDRDTNRLLAGIEELAPQIQSRSAEMAVFRFRWQAIGITPLAAR
ncbi:MAG: hypothetical protein JO025_26850 [Verrucomicrobia bacterium]|nr:hypothetical protein [Verrucomicrobiota bacterium]